MYFEVACEGRVVYVALATTAQAKVKAAGAKALKERGWGAVEAADLTIRTPRGMSVRALATRWTEHFLDLDETIDILLREDDECDPEDRPPMLSPRRLRAEIPGWPETMWGEVEGEWTHTMRLLGKGTPERRAFESAFDKITSRRISSRAYARLPEIARKMLRENEPDLVTAILCGRYWVHPNSVRNVVHVESRR
ncbi:hypothetical protein [Methylobacterium sp. CCH7-A2]|uniref:hypothetical protein n=1 Tax=Methylobacterium sp. CCH7-A2 TaxID=1768789 RepID=UPI0012E3BCC4|nr:hypothetical protein [Methylobacterium sp. CCH7-A2]